MVHCSNNKALARGGGLPFLTALSLNATAWFQQLTSAVGVGDADLLLCTG